MNAEPKSVRAGAVLRDILEAAVLAAVLFVVLQFALQNTIVEGASMEPNFIDREWLLVNKLAYRWSDPARGDVIVFDSPETEDKEFIKRVIGLPGETVAIRRGAVHIDGRPIDEPWRPIRDAGSYGPFTVPDGSYFVLGDNRPNSNDSRTFNGVGGALPRAAIVGKAWLVVWPFAAWGFVQADGPSPASARGPG